MSVKGTVKKERYFEGYSAAVAVIVAAAGDREREKIIRRVHKKQKINNKKYNSRIQEKALAPAAHHC